MNMLLPNPADVASPEAGPLWAHDLNDALEIVDTHDHYNAGVQVPSLGLKMNADLPFTFSGSYYGPTLAAYYGFNPMTAPTAGTHTSSLYVNAAGSLYYRGNTGTDILLSTNSVISATGTGLYNGFYGDYAAAGPTANAVAYYRTASSTFEFYGPLGGGLTVPAGYNQTANLQAKTYASYTPGTPSLAFVAFDPATTSFGGAPEGGWALATTNTLGRGMTISMDSTAGLVSGADGQYLNAVVGVYNSTSYGSPGTWGFSVNRPETDGTFKGRAANPLDIWLYAATTNAPQVVSTFTALSTGTPVANYGNRVAFLAGGAVWAGYGNALPTIRTQGAIDSFFQSATTANGSGLRFRGAYGGTLSTTPAIEIAALVAGVDYVGIGGAAVSTALLTMYGNIAPSADNLHNLGLAGTQFATVYARNFSALGNPLGLTGSTITLTGATTVTGVLTTSTTIVGGGSISAANNISAVGQVTAGAAVQGTVMYPTSAPASMTVNTGGSFKNNQILAHGSVNAAAGTAIYGYNFSVNRTGLGVFTITFTVAPAAASYSVVAMISAATAGTVDAVMIDNQGAASFRLTTTSAAAVADRNFHFIVVGSP